MQVIETNLEFGNLKPRQFTKRIIIHHSASIDTTASTIHSWHLGQGWSGIGYHFVIKQNGEIERGRPIDTIGAHAGTAGNVDSIGICLTGNFNMEDPTNKQLNSLILLIRYLREKYGNLDVMGHKDVMATACPGSNFPWEKLLKEVNRVIYEKLEDMPDWAKPTIKKLVDRKTLVGDGKGNLNLSEDVVKVLSILDREGVFK